ncbi:unnamed protein product [Amoebophrya sp. A25]|nr:unnamed protein product [Amoebophrya sp. A25]|eukprot:GSA25T00015659001.1
MSRSRSSRAIGGRGPAGLLLAFTSVSQTFSSGLGVAVDQAQTTETEVRSVLKDLGQVLRTTPEAVDLARADRLVTEASEYLGHQDAESLATPSTSVTEEDGVEEKHQPAGLSLLQSAAALGDSTMMMKKRFGIDMDEMNLEDDDAEDDSSLSLLQTSAITPPEAEEMLINDFHDENGSGTEQDEHESEEAEEVADPLMLVEGTSSSSSSNALVGEATSTAQEDEALPAAKKSSTSSKNVAEKFKKEKKPTTPSSSKRTAASISAAMGKKVDEKKAAATDKVIKKTSNKKTGKAASQKKTSSSASKSGVKAAAKKAAGSGHKNAPQEPRSQMLRKEMGRKQGQKGKITQHSKKLPTEKKKTKPTELASSKKKEQTGLKKGYTRSAAKPAPKKKTGNTPVAMVETDTAVLDPHAVEQLRHDVLGVVDAFAESHGSYYPELQAHAFHPAAIMSGIAQGFIPEDQAHRLTALHAKPLSKRMLTLRAKVLAAVEEFSSASAPQSTDLLELDSSEMSEEDATSEQDGEKSEEEVKETSGEKAEESVEHAAIRFGQSRVKQHMEEEVVSASSHSIQMAVKLGESGGSDGVEHNHIKSSELQASSSSDESGSGPVSSSEKEKVSSSSSSGSFSKEKAASTGDKRDQDADKDKEEEDKVIPGFLGDIAAADAEEERIQGKKFARDAGSKNGQGNSGSGDAQKKKNKDGGADAGGDAKKMSSITQQMSLKLQVAVDDDEENQKPPEDQDHDFHRTPSSGASSTTSDELGASRRAAKRTISASSMGMSNKSGSASFHPEKKLKKQVEGLSVEGKEDNGATVIFGKHQGPTASEDASVDHKVDSSSSSSSSEVEETTTSSKQAIKKRTPVMETSPSSPIGESKRTLKLTLTRNAPSSHAPAQESAAEETNKSGTSLLSVASARTDSKPITAALVLERLHRLLS